MTFNEYTPKCGWYAYNRRRQLRRKKLKSAGYAALFFVAYAAMATAFYYI